MLRPIRKLPAQHGELPGRVDTETDAVAIDPFDVHDNPAANTDLFPDFAR
jgi:hypothetical protein